MEEARLEERLGVVGYGGEATSPLFFLFGNTRNEREEKMRSGL